jgi:hypothetical protein
VREWSCYLLPKKEAPKRARALRRQNQIKKRRSATTTTAAASTADLQTHVISLTSTNVDFGWSGSLLSSIDLSLSQEGKKGRKRRRVMNF